MTIRQCKTVLSDKEVDVIAEATLRLFICQHCHGRPRNIDRIRKAFNAKALQWVANQHVRPIRDVPQAQQVLEKHQQRRKGASV